MHSFTFNGHSSDEFGIRIERFPDLNRSERKYKSASVSGRNGNIYQMESAWEEVTVSYQIFAGERQAGAAVTDFTDIVEWLNSADDYAVLTDTYDPTHYRMAVFVDDLDIESEWHTFGKATVRFRCRPQRFLVENPVSVASGDTITNDTNHIAKPIITLTGNGARSLFPMSLKSLSASGLSGMTSELYSVLNGWNNDYVYWVKAQNSIYNLPIIVAGTNQNTGTLSVISAQNGQLKFTTADVSYGLGWVCNVNPNADYVLSMSATKNSRVKLWFAEQDGYNHISAYQQMDISANGSNSIQFRTPSNCGYILVGLYSLTTGTDVTFNNIMLTTGTEVKPFRPWSATTVNNFTIGSTTLQFESSGFDGASIDCERENFILDDAEANIVSSIVDEFGNPSLNYLQLEKGANTVTFSSDIASVTVDKRLWQL